MAIEVAKVELKNVQDASGMEAAIKKGQFKADEVIAVIGKTEGNGGANDFTRGFATLAFSLALARRLGVLRRRSSQARRFRLVRRHGRRAEPARDRFHPQRRPRGRRQTPCAGHRGHP